jgi:pSer/pThr/pTyr-binding forkhead associated (FHA) protein
MLRTLLSGLLLGALAGVIWRFWRSRRPIAKIAFREGDGTGLEFPLRNVESTIGSAEEHTVTVSHPRVSRLHAVVTFEKDRFVLQDRSRYGIRVNAEPVSESVELKSGDLIRLGDSVDLIFTRLVPPRTR